MPGIYYTPRTKKAMQIAFSIHRDQCDKGGLPYIYHPVHIAEQMDTEDEICVALLHDVMEDSSMRPEDLRREGFSDRIITALLLLTHKENIPYREYIAAIKTNPLAAKIKLADLRHNTDISRLETIDEKVKCRLQKYQESISLLQEPEK